MWVISFIIIIILLWIAAAMYVFPFLAAASLIVSVVRKRALRLPYVLTSILLLALCFCAWMTYTVIFYDAGYLFHHDFGSKVYNEGYIIPYYESMYGEELELVEKEVIDSCNAVYQLRSGITGECFLVESRNYDTNSGSTDRLHLSADYDEILGERLEAEERISLPLDKGYQIKLSTGEECYILIFDRKDYYSLTVDIPGTKRTEKEVMQKIQGDRFSIQLEEGKLVLFIPVKEDSFSVHRIPLALQ